MSVSIIHKIAWDPADILMSTSTAHQNSVCNKAIIVEWPLQGEYKKRFKEMLKHIFE